MEEYPDDLLEGVSPLVFAVDATRDSATPASSASADDGEGPAVAEAGEGGEAAGPNAAGGGRTVFQLFLDAIGGKEEDADRNERRQRHPLDDSLALPAAPSDDEADGGEGTGDDDGDDEASKPSAPPPIRSGSPFLDARQNFQKTVRKLGAGGLGRVTSSSSDAEAGGGATSATASSSQPPPPTPYGRVVASSSSSSPTTPQRPFFSRARIVPVSRRHAFPPSSDPDGTKGRVGGGGGVGGASSSTSPLGQPSIPSSSVSTSSSLVGGTAAALPGGVGSTQAFHRLRRAALEANPVEGILPAGWLEKHSHALPSVLIVVSKLDLTTSGKDGSADAHDRALVETFETLRATTADKRECRLHLVCLLSSRESLAGTVGGGAGGSGGGDVGAGGGGADPTAVAQSMEAERITSLRNGCKLAASAVTVLRIESDLLRPPDVPPGPALRRFHRTVRDASDSYYLAQARRAKRKLSNLGHDRHPELLPLAARYGFKIGTYYEFQANRDKSLRFYDEAYGLVEKFHRHCLAKASDLRRSHVREATGGGGEGGSAEIAEEGDEGGVEVKLLPPTTAAAAADDDDEEGGGAEGGAGGAGASGSVPGGPPPPPPPPVPPPPPSQSAGAAAARPPAIGPLTEEGALEREKARVADMIRQCRTVADWINFKLLQAAFLSSSSSPSPSSDSALPPLPPQRPVAGGGVDDDGNDVFGSGLGAAAAQSRRHRISYLSRSATESESDSSAPAWEVWSCEARDRAVFSQLAERHNRPPPPPSSSSTRDDDDDDDARVHCSAWRSYAAAAEAVLRAGTEVRRELARGAEGAPGGGDDDGNPRKNRFNNSRPLVAATTTTSDGKDRGRYVGGLDGGGYDAKLEIEAKKDHSALALAYAERALSLLEIESSSSKRERSSWARSAARPRCVAGGILLRAGRHDEAAVHLERALEGSSGWTGLSRPIRRMLAECHERRRRARRTGDGASVGGGSTADDDAASSLPSSSSAVAVALATAFDASPRASEEERAEARIAFERVVAAAATTTTAPPIAHSVDVGTTSSPFSFAATFPASTHATSGDVVPLAVSIRSNLSYPVRVRAVTARSNAGDVDVPPIPIGSTDVAKAGRGTRRMGGRPVESDDDDDAAKRGGGRSRGFVMEPGAVAFLSSKLVLPNDVDDIGPAGSRNAPSKTSASSKAKAAGVGRTVKPNAASVTRAAGASLLFEQKVRGSQSNDANGSSKRDRYIGGAPVEFDGLVLGLGSCAAEDEKCGRVGPSITLALQTPPPVTHLTTKRTHPLEEENYVASAWRRPPHHPLSLGPNCLRVHGPIPAMEVTDLTSLVTGGRAMEGTVNRLLLRLRAGRDEECADVRCQVTCASGTPLADGSIARAIQRSPILVEPVDDVDGGVEAGRDGDPPAGWKARGDSNDDAFEEVTPSLPPGGVVYTSVDLYRPLPTSPLPPRKEGDVVVGATGGGGLGDDPCRTDFEVTVAYRQTRRRTADGPSPAGSDAVTRLYRGSVAWCAPLAAHFSAADGASRGGHPSGSRHRSNLLPPGDVARGGPAKSLEPAESGDGGAASDEGTTTAATAAMIAGETIQVRCSLRAEEAKHGLGVTIDRVLFEASEEADGDDEPEYDLKLISTHEKSGGGQLGEAMLYAPRPDDVSNKLTAGAKFGLSYALKAEKKREGGATRAATGGSVSSLGILSVDWSPIALPLPKEVIENRGSRTVKGEGAERSHGPLPLSGGSSTLKFLGPNCHVERAPFEAVLQSFPPAPKVAVPFEVKYRLTNRTALHQKLLVSMSDSNPEDDAGDGGGHPSSSSTSDGVLVSGMVNGELLLAPAETRTLRYTALATRAGKTPMPAVTVKSVRHGSWVINDGPSNVRHFFVLP